MNVVACIARVPDTAVRLRIAPDGKSIATDGVQYVVNPFDDFALEEAVRTKEALGGELTVLHVGPADFQKDLRQCLAKGADRALHLKVSGPLGPESIASLLAERIQPFALRDGTAVSTREIEGGVETIETTLPAVFTCEKGLNEPRRAGLKEIMAAKKKPLDVEEVTAAAPGLELLALEPPPDRPPGRILGEGVEAVPALVEALRNEAKVI